MSGDPWSIVACTLFYFKRCREKDGSVGVEDAPENENWQAFGSYKAEMLLQFSARSFALAGWGTWKLSLNSTSASSKNSGQHRQSFFFGPMVEDSRRCEAAALRQAVRLMLSSGCKVEGALHTTMIGLGIYEKLNWGKIGGDSLLYEGKGG